MNRLLGNYILYMFNPSSKRKENSIEKDKERNKRDDEAVAYVVERRERKGRTQTSFVFSRNEDTGQHM